MAFHESLSIKYPKSNPMLLPAPLHILIGWPPHGVQCAAPVIYHASSEAAGDVRLRARITRRGKELRRGTELDELPDEQECREVADAGGLLHVMRDDGNGAEIL